MSVHAEYTRALANLLDRLQGVNEPELVRSRSALEEARVERNPDLSAAARRALQALRDLDAALAISNSNPGGGSPADVLREPFAHLEAHCRAILGSAA